MPNKEELLRVKDIVERFGISERTLYRYIKEGKLKAVRLGTWRIHKDDWAKFIEANVNVQPKKRASKKK